MALQDDMQPKIGRIYFIACAGSIKIGMTLGSPYTRLRALQTGSPLPLQLLTTWEVDAAHAQIAERLLHNMFEDCLVSGEWYRIDIDRLSGARAALREKLEELRRDGRLRLDGLPKRKRYPPLAEASNFDIDEITDLLRKSGEAERIARSDAITRRFEMAELRRALESDVDAPSATTSR